MSKTFDRFAGIAFLLIGLLFVIESQRLSESSYGSAVGPDIFPLGLGIFLVLLSLRLLYETFRYQTSAKSGEPVQYIKFVIIFVSALLYIVLLEPLGYVITTFIFLLIAFQTMERGKWIQSIVIALLFSGGVYYFFAEFLGGSLPGFPVF
ncbi:tripartite tricarboxylate transporter TctB family protein [Planococcus sp. N028]|uniref:Tripartite tricarboxylate transporter TctB family protein n=1 Tax=Planococcus shixiaomingii TaxID=3058393 RepID=A0ABT8N1Y9_9BACL|nr:MULTISPECIES: tripartite tricarboxylate transporter TctB family protein [unclassified Planococcus (in: firmicutes)]MDN7241900.1 tripartite tricarboxylate transporter TctB family protein [Planococcus sp. N028]WKA54185.1 tripartite tricarboxylate transporter TctB family protein [Planococcus sp. N022]